MSSHSDGGPAFPCKRTKRINDGLEGLANEDLFPAKIEIRHPGMSLRDYFAGQALAHLSPLVYRERKSVQEWAAKSYHIADAMLAERGQERGRNVEDASKQLAAVPMLQRAAEQVLEEMDGVIDPSEGDGFAALRTALARMQGEDS